MSTEKYNTAWLENLWEEFNFLQDQVDQYLESLHTVPDHVAINQLQKTKGKFESLKMDISSCINMLLSKTSPTTQSLNSASVQVYEGLLPEIYHLFTTDLQVLTNKLTELDSINASSYTMKL